MKENTCLDLRGAAGQAPQAGEKKYYKLLENMRRQKKGEWAILEMQIKSNLVIETWKTPVPGYWKYALELEVVEGEFAVAKLLEEKNIVLFWTRREIKDYADFWDVFGYYCMENDLPLPFKVDGSHE